MIIDLVRHDITCTKYPSLNLVRISQNLKEINPFYHYVSFKKNAL